MNSPALLLTLATNSLAQPAWKADGNRALELVAGESTLVRFVVDAAPRDPHFEILATADGRNTVWVAPPDHVWHYGMWFSWKYVNGVNFWETDPKTGKQPGLNRIEGAAILSQPDGDAAIIRYRELAHPANPGHPVSWYLFCDPKLPFWFANPARVQPKPIARKKGEKIQHAYRVVVHDGSMEGEEITQAVGGGVEEMNEVSHRLQASALAAEKSCH